MNTQSPYICAIFLSTFLLLSHTFWGQAQIRLQDQTFSIGEVNELIIDLNQQQPPSKVIEPDLPDQLDLSPSGDWIQQGEKYIKKYELIAWDSGYFQIPPFTVVDGQKTYQTSSLNIQVLDVQLDSIPQSMIRDIIEEPVTLSDYLDYLYVLLGIVGLGLLAYFSFKNRNREEGLVDPPIEALIRAPHVVALEKMQMLKEQYLKGMETEDYHTRLNYVLREYLSRRFRLPSLESGTRQLQQQLRALTNVDPSIQQSLIEALPVVEQIKYAQQNQDSNFDNSLFDTTHKLITNTQLSGHENTQKYQLNNKDIILQPALENGLQRVVPLGSIEELNKLLLNKNIYETPLESTILYRWTWKFPFAKIEKAPIELPHEIIQWHTQSESYFYKLYNPLGVKLTSWGLLSSLLFTLLHPLFLIPLGICSLLDLIKGKKPILKPGKIELVDRENIRFNYEVESIENNKEV